MGEVIPYEVFREYQRKKKYGDTQARLKAMNFPDDFNPFQDEADEYHRACYGEDESDEEDYWLGEKSLCEVIQ